MGLDFSYEYGQTPLTLDEIEGLIPTHINTQYELNQWETQNILQARRWLSSRRPKEVLNISFALKLHSKMFSDTWRWAGKIRNTEKNIGVSPFEITQALTKLFDGVKYWIDKSTYDPDEIGTRLHNKLAWIHPFNNGNGRHARLFTDLFMMNNKWKPFTWGINQKSKLTIREQYIRSMREADEKKFESLRKFMRS